MAAAVVAAWFERQHTDRRRGPAFGGPHRRALRLTRAEGTFYGGRGFFHRVRDAIDGLAHPGGLVDRVHQMADSIVHQRGEQCQIRGGNQ